MSVAVIVLGTTLTLATPSASGAPVTTRAPVYDIEIFSPIGGATYEIGTRVPASYDCVGNGYLVFSCDGDVPLGGLIDTGTVGVHTFTVQASFFLELYPETTWPLTRSVTYTVVAAVRQPDLWGRPQNNNVYSSTPGGQSELSTTSSIRSSGVEFHIQNDGTRRDSFVVRGAGDQYSANHAALQWRVEYHDPSIVCPTRPGRPPRPTCNRNDVTTRVTGNDSSFETSQLNPGQKYTLIMLAFPNIPGVQLSRNIRATSVRDASKVDTMQVQARDFVE